MFMKIFSFNHKPEATKCAGAKRQSLCKTIRYVLGPKIMLNIDYVELSVGLRCGPVPCAFLILSHMKLVQIDRI